MIFLSTEFWVAFQMCVLLFLLLFLWYFIRNSKAQVEENPVSEESVNQVVNLLEPLLREAESSAAVFESQILEKKQLIRQLNEKLDSRIISLNLLLNRADACLVNNAGMKTDIDVAGIQESILSLYEDGYNTSAISKELSVSEQEIDLVIGLKKKFLAMEKNMKIAT